MPTLAEDRDEIRDLFARYCVYIDTGAVQEWAALFTEDGVFGVGPEPLVGTEALVGFATNVGPGMHHMVANEVIEVTGDAATARASIMVLRGGVVMTSGRYEDELRREPGGWRLAKRMFSPDPRPAK